MAMTLKNYDHASTRWLKEFDEMCIRLDTMPKVPKVNIISLLMHSLVSSTIVISVVLTFNIALVFLNLYATVYCEI